jgi:hypothetical protein
MNEIGGGEVEVSKDYADLRERRFEAPVARHLNLTPRADPGHGPESTQPTFPTAI